MDKHLSIMDNPDDLMAFLDGGEDNLKRVGNGPGDWHEFIDKYARAFAAKDADATEEQRKGQIAEVFQEYIETQEKAKGVSRVPMTDETAKRAAGGIISDGVRRDIFRKAHNSNPASPAAKAYSGIEPFEHFGDFLTSMSNHFHQRGLDPRLKDMNESMGGEGGFLVPEEYRAELMRLSLENAIVRPRARTLPMGGPTLRIPSIRDTSHATNVFGGVSGSWVQEAGTVSSSTNQPTFQQILLTARKLTGYTVASNELLADSAIGLESLIGELFPEAISYFEDDAFINGTGGGQPLGILNANALVAQAKETGQAAATIIYQNLLKMYSRMVPSSLSRAVWVAHMDTLPQLGQLSLEVGTGGSALWIMNASQGVPMSIFGRPLLFTEKCQTVGTAGDIYFVDLGHYLIGDRQALTMARSEHVNFTSDEIAWKFVQRVDGRPWLTSALTPRNGSTTLSPFVNLATRS